ncbi:tetratricopeptide repeat protein [Plebeiibacterium sediminum]|uniref:Tetratricopeptide repeat protein n=1 Tax=Plebeiibacterium sediminum TaxID=2992112 RepID=A0AAE3M6D4_9BACT|nr:hypothetical protein [Plebeiobacterium sediminum]MCW3787782.1 hypothetical protein [Plebeiobacterium sediminum]
MKKLLFTLCTVIVCSGLFAESRSEMETNTNKEDSIACLKHYSIYVLNLKKKMYDYTLESWNYMFKNCPDAGVRIYADGLKLYEHYYKVAQTSERQSEVVDTIMMIYDQRIKYFGTHPKYPEGWVRGRKALDLVKYKRGNREAMMQAYKEFKASFELLGNKSEDVVLFNYLKTSSVLFEEGELDAMQFFSDYLTISTVLDVQIAKAVGDSKERKGSVRESCDELLVKSGAGDCDLIQPFLNDQFTADQENIQNVSRIVKLLDHLGCTESALYYTAVETNYALNPSSSAAHELAKMYVKKQAFDKAKEFYQKAIENCSIDDERSELYYELAVLDFAHFEDYKQARDLAKKAISTRGDWGKPYILIGNIYAAESKKYGKNDFEHSTVYWIALDKYQKAKSIDKSCEEEADKQITLYSQYLPDKETGFFHGLTEGDQYTIESWINETTKVRFR